MPNFQNTGIPTNDVLRRYVVEYHLPDFSKKKHSMEVEAYHEDQAEEKIIAGIRNYFSIFAEEIEEQEEPDRPIVM